MRPSLLRIASPRKPSEARSTHDPYLSGEVFVNTVYLPTHVEAEYPVQVHVVPALENRNRLTVAFRPILAIPHLLLVGGPVAAGLWWTTASDGNNKWGLAGGVLGGVAVVSAMIGWFSILFTGTFPRGLQKLVRLYLRWRVRGIAYVALLRDEYPPFEDSPYPAWVRIEPTTAPRDKLTVAFRLLLLLPHFIILWLLGVAWALSALASWGVIILTGRMPAALAEFGTGMLRWNTRIEAYALLLEDRYPPFSLDQ